MNPLPTPAGWKSRYLLFGFMIAIMGLAAVVASIATAFAVSQHNWLMMIALALEAAASTICALALGRIFAGRPKLRASCGHTGTTLTTAPASRWAAIVLASVVVGCSIQLLAGRHDIDRFGLLRAVAMMGFLIWLLVSTIRAMRRGRPALTLSVYGIRYDNPVSAAAFEIPWQEIREVTGVMPAGRAFRPVVFHHRYGAPAVIPNVTSYGSVALFWMIRHYWLHPQTRPELHNGVAIERLAARHFVAQ